MTEVVVIGSGASGVHFALTALERGHRVTIVDVGYPRPDPVAPDATYRELRTTLEDPVRFLLGERGEGVVYPATKASFYGQPPSKAYVFRSPDRFRVRARAMEPVFSFARGGFAEAWTGGSYEFSDADLAPFGLTHAELAPHYRTVADRIGIGGEADDLARFIPFEASYLPPLPLDPHSAHLVDRYRERREALQRDLRFHLGRSRVATLSRDHRGRSRCTQLGRCLWGCPVQAIYPPSVTLRECLGHAGCRYLPGVLVSHFETEADGRIRAVAGTRLEDDQPVRVEGEWFALAAGTLPSSKIVLDSLRRRDGSAPCSAG